MDKIYIDYDNTDILDMPIDDSNYAECKLIGYADLNDEFHEWGKADIGNIQVGKKGKSQFWIYVGGNEENYVPHIHILRAKYGKGEKGKWNNAIVLKLLENAYFNHSASAKKNCKLHEFDSKDEFDTVIEFLKSSKGGQTKWEYACEAWNNLNFNLKIPDEQIEEGMPDYDFDTLKNYNER